MTTATTSLDHSLLAALRIAERLLGEVGPAAVLNKERSATFFAELQNVRSIIAIADHLKLHPDDTLDEHQCDAIDAIIAQAAA